MPTINVQLTESTFNNNSPPPFLKETIHLKKCVRPSVISHDAQLSYLTIFHLYSPFSQGCSLNL